MAKGITEYVTTVKGKEVYRGADIEKAIRTWDANTFNMEGIVSGSISVTEMWDDVMVRDGYLLHVTDTGRVYLSPTLSTK